MCSLGHDARALACSRRRATSLAVERFGSTETVYARARPAARRCRRRRCHEGIRGSRGLLLWCIAPGSILVTKRPGSRAEDVLGRVVLNYKIDRLIGAGAMGAVYAATSLVGGKRAAVKVMLLELCEHAESFDRFIQEALIAGSIDHPNILEAWGFGYFPEDGRLFMLMPLIEGRSLHEMCKEGLMRSDYAVSIAMQSADGLDAVHRIGVVHRDFKPGNVLIANRHNIYPSPRVLDFGVARLIRPYVPGQGPMRTLTGAVLGTPGHMAPEQAGGARDVDARADVYSWGVLLYLMLTGRTPYESESLWDLVMRAQTGAKFPRPRSFRPDIYPAWEDVIMECLEFLPRNRPTLEQAVRRLADPLVERDLLLSVLAPNLARPARLGSGDRPFTGELDPRWFDLRSTPQRRRSIAVAAGAAIAAGLVTTALAVEFTSGDGDQEQAPPPLTLASSSAQAPANATKGGSDGSAMAEGVGLPFGHLESLLTDRATAPAPAATPPGSVSSGSSQRSRGHAATATADTGEIEVVTPPPKPITSGSAAGLRPAEAKAAAEPDPSGATTGSGASRRAPSAGPTPAPSSRGPGTTDTGSGSSGAREQSKSALIIVKANPWAVVSIDGVKLGQTTVRYAAKPGTYKIELSGPDGQTATVERSVKPGDNLITWQWEQKPE